MERFIQEKRVVRFLLSKEINTVYKTNIIFITFIVILKKKKMQIVWRTKVQKIAKSFGLQNKNKPNTLIIIWGLWFLFIHLIVNLMVYLFIKYETKYKRNETKWNLPKRNKTYQNETKLTETKSNQNKIKIETNQRNQIETKTKPNQTKTKQNQTYRNKMK